MPTVMEMEAQQKAREGDELLARPLFLQAVADYKADKGEFVYPDANSSLRITFGNVQGYTKLDGTRDAPFTTVEQLAAKATRSDEHTSEFQSLMRISYAVFCLKKTTTKQQKMN